MSRFRRHGSKEHLAPYQDQFLKDIKSDFDQDKQKWDSSVPEANLVHLWKKYKRTESQLEQSVEELNTIKSQQKKQIDEMQQYVTSIKKLQEGKNSHIEELMKDNNDLTEKARQGTIERETYLKQYQAIADLLTTEGSNEFDAYKQIQTLIRESTSYQANIKSQQDALTQLEEDKRLTEEDWKAREKILQEEKEASIATASKLTHEKNELLHQLDNIKEVQVDQEKALESAIKECRDLKGESTKWKNQFETERLNCEEVVQAKHLALETLRVSEETYEANKSERNKLLEQVESKDVELKSFQEMKVSLLKEIDTLSQEQEGKENEQKTLTDTLTITQLQLEKVETALKESEATNETFRTKIVTMEMASDALKDELEQLQISQTEAEANIESIKSRTENEVQSSIEQTSLLSSELAETNRVQQKLVKDNEQLSKDLHTRTHKVDDLTQEIVSEKEKVTRLETELHERETQFKSETETLKQEKLASNRMLETCKESLKGIAKETISYLSSRMTEMNTRAQDLETQLRNLQERFNQYISSAKIRQMETIKRQEENMETATAAVEREHEQLSEINMQLKGKCLALEESNTEHTEDINSLEKKLANLQSNSTLVSQSVQQQWKEEKDRLEQHCNDLRTQLQEKSDTVERLHEEVDSVSKAANESQTQLLSLTSQFQGIQSELTETNNGKQNLTRRNSSLGAELNAKQEMILSIQRKYREEKATLESKIHLLTQEQHTLEVKLRESNRQVQETKQQLHRLQKELDEENKSMQITLDATRTALVSEKKKLSIADDMQMKLQTEINEYKQEVVCSNEQMRKLEGVKVANQRLVQQMKASEEKLKELQVVQLAREKDYEEASNTITDLEDKLRKVEEIAYTKESNALQLQEQLRKLEAQIETTERQLHFAETQRRALEQENQEKKAILEEARNESELLHTTYAHYESHMKVLEAKLLASQKQIYTAEKDKTDCQSKLQEVGSDMSLFKYQIEKLETQNSTKEESVYELKEKISSLQIKQDLMEETLHEREALMIKLKTKAENKRKKLLEELAEKTREKCLLEGRNKILRIELAEIKVKSESLNETIIDNEQDFLHRREHLKEKLKGHNHKTKVSLESEIEVVSDELYSTRSKLDHEVQWREEASSLHSALLKEQSRLQACILSLEAQVRKKNFKIVELQTINIRLEQENEMFQQKLDTSLSPLRRPQTAHGHYSMKSRELDSLTTSKMNRTT